MPDKYLAVDLTNGRFKQVPGTVTSSGAAQAGQLVALGADGKLDPSVVGSGSGAGGDVQNTTATEALNAGDWVNLYNNSGSAAARKALAQDGTKPARGFVLVFVGAGSAVNVYLSGVNAKIPVSGFSANDIGKNVFCRPSLIPVDILASVQARSAAALLNCIVEGLSAHVLQTK